MSGLVPIRLAYKVFEPVSGTIEEVPIIFLHGSTLSKEHWADIPQVVANATKRKVYAVDARNHGDSEWSDEYNFDMNSDDLVHFMDTMSIPKAILVGHSMGGASAIRTAILKPHKVEMIIVEDIYVRKLPKSLLDMVVPYITLLQEAVEHMPHNVDEDKAKKFIIEYLRSHLPKEFSGFLNLDFDNLHIGELKRNPDGRYSFKANLKVLQKAMENPETLMEEPSGVYYGPACFIYGTLSPLQVGSDKPHIKQYFPKAEFVEIEGATHDVHPERPLEFTDAVVKFISQAGNLS